MAGVNRGYRSNRSNKDYPPPKARRLGRLTGRIDYKFSLLDLLGGTRVKRRRSVPYSRVARRDASIWPTSS